MYKIYDSEMPFFKFLESELSAPFTVSLSRRIYQNYSLSRNISIPTWPCEVTPSIGWFYCSGTMNIIYMFYYRNQTINSSA